MLDTKNLPNVAPETDLEVLFEAGCHFGHKTKRWHPKMAPFIYTQKNGVHIFDLAKTASQLQLAYNFIYNQAKHGKQIVFVGTKRQAKDILKTQAEKAGAFYIVSRWMGGFISNWEQIVKSIKRMTKIEEGLKTDAYKGYTKFERNQLEKELSRLERFFAGVKNLKAKPDCLVVIDAGKEKGAVKEAEALDIPVVALVDSNTNPSNVTIPVPANDDSIKSLELLIGKLVEAYSEGKKVAK